LASIPAVTPHCRRILLLPFSCQVVQLAEHFLNILHPLGDAVCNGGWNGRFVVAIDESLLLKKPQPLLGAWLLVLFLVPVTLMMHNFWAVRDPMMAQLPMAMFLKNVTMLGGALLVSQFGAGPLSLDARRDSVR
jgi:hypothetical protein